MALDVFLWVFLFFLFFSGFVEQRSHGSADHQLNDTEDEPLEGQAEGEGLRHVYVPNPMPMDT